MRGREARHFIAGVRDPDPILLVNGEVKWPEERLARLSAVAFADDAALGPVTLWEMDELALRDAQSPYVFVRGHADALHQAELAVESDLLWWRQRLAGLVEHRDRLASITAEPRIILGVDGRAEGAALHVAVRKARRHRGQRTAVRGELCRVALP